MGELKWKSDDVGPEEVELALGAVEFREKVILQLAVFWGHAAWG